MSTEIITTTTTTTTTDTVSSSSTTDTTETISALEAAAKLSAEIARLNELVNDFGYGGGGVKYGEVEAGKKRILISGYNKTGKNSLNKYITDNLTKVAANNKDSLQQLGFTNDTIDFKMKSLSDAEYGGRMSHLALWSHYVPNISGIILCIDSSDIYSLGIRQVKTGLIKKKTVYKQTKYSSLQYNLQDQLLSLQGLAPVLIFATKQDLQGSVSNDDIMKALGFPYKNHKRPVHIQSLNANTFQGDGLIKGLEWLSKHLELVRPENTNTSQEESQVEGIVKKENPVHNIPIEKPVKGNKLTRAFKSFFKLVF